jgi:lipoprotein NlpI
MHRMGTCLVLGLVFAAMPQTLKAQSSTEFRAAALRALQQGDHATAIEHVNDLLKAKPGDARTQLFAGDIFLRAGESKKAVEQFDAFLKQEPRELPYLWQRGIALYFVSQFKEGVKQFEVHREVNPNDVENAAWHFLCVAKADSFDKAEKMVLPAPGDPRLPMEEVLRMLSTGNTQAVIDRIEKQAPGTASRSQAEFYGYFYLGLYEDAKGNRTEALQWMKRSAKDAPRNYMGDVARVYAEYLSKASAPPETP